MNSSLADAKHSAEQMLALSVVILVAAEAAAALERA